MEKIVGIDLGTTNSAIAHVEEGVPKTIPNSSGNNITPSVVTISDDNTRIVGEAAKNMQIQKPNRTISSIKRKMGEDHSVEVDGNEYTPQEISSYILDKLVRGAERTIDEDVEKAVITVPAYFNDRQRNATIDAGRISDFEVERIINEPTAAAMAYGLSGDEDSTILVYDLGGGTFDVSILDIGSGLYEIKSTAGINDLGGVDWTERIADKIHSIIEDQYNTTISDPRSKQRVFEEAEEAKKELSNSRQTDIIIPFLSENEEGESINVNYTITREDFENMAADLLDRTVQPVEQSIEDAGIEKSDIDEVLLVGGSTRMPQVQNLVEDKLGIQPRDDIDPEKVVAKGAAIQAAILDEKRHDGEIDDIVLLDVAPISLGVEVEGGLFEPVIEKNTTIPAQKMKVFTTSKNSQTSVTINIYQGERKIADKNTLLESFKLKGIPKMPPGQPEIEVRFTVNENGVLSVSAREDSTGRRKDIQVEGNVGMSEEEVSEARSDALEHRKDDAIQTKRIKAENLAKTQVNQAESILKAYDVPDRYEKQIEEKISEIESVLDKTALDEREVEDLSDDLERLIEEVTVQYL